MKFKHGTRRKPIEYERALIEYWKTDKTFEKSVEQRPLSERYIFYDGPPFITGVPHHGTLLSSIVKDAVPRYWTMKGKRVERVWGWDCHGLPAEVYVENKLGIKDKREIGTTISLEEYITTCRDNMVQTGSEWEDTIDRIGRWVDFKGAYKTMDKNYMESVWWAFKELYDKGKIYEGEKVLLYCTRDATPLSKAEVTMDAGAYQDVTDPSVYVKFKLADQDKYLLAWTTTPWTLPSNSALAVNKALDYTEIEIDGEILIMADLLLERVLTDERHQILPFKRRHTFKGAELVGLSYVPLFGPIDGLADEKAFKIWHAEFVHADEGTGIAHESPAYGEEDYELSRQEGFPWIMSTDQSGMFIMGDWVGENVWEVNKQIAKDLHERGIVWKIEYITHPYPHCHRCGTKLMYRAHPSWFVDIQSQKQQMMDENENIYWFPEHIKHGRFAKTVEASPDWNISRDRFWATPLPVWKGLDKSGNELIKVVGSFAELKQLSGVELEDYHRPWIDDVKFTIDGVVYSRIDKVMDSWFESGSMPFAQFHYPFENVDMFETSFPGNFIAEYIGQVRAWFYYLHALSVGLFGKHSFKNVIVTGTLAGNDGRKMSKSYGNFTDPNKLMDTYSADAYRFVLLGSPVLSGEDFALIDKDVADANRKLSMVWNMYDFFTMYAEVDGWEWDGSLDDPIGTLQNTLDEWIVSKVHQLTAEVDAAMLRYDIPNAVAQILPFIDDASNWYVRRSRRRFWKSEDDADKAQAYTTLHYVLVRLACVLAPFAPFMAEELYQLLTARKSVHLESWPNAGNVNELLIKEMATVRDIVSQGLAQRAQAGVKVRQPLKQVKVVAKTTVNPEMQSIVAEELNVKNVHTSIGETEVVELDIKITTELRDEGIARDIIRRIQELRKRAGLEVNDRIDLHISSTKFQRAIGSFKKLIMAETLARGMSESANLDFQDTFEIDGHELLIAIRKHAND